MLCTFVVVNGLNPEIFLEWIDVIGMATDKHSVREFKSLLYTFLKKSQRNGTELMVTTFLTTDTEFINGKVKCYLDYSVKRPQW